MKTEKHSLFSPWKRYGKNIGHLEPRQIENGKPYCFRGKQN